MPVRSVEESARGQAESQQAEEAAARHAAAEEQRSAAMRAIEQECAALQSRVDASDAAFAQAEQHAQSIGATVRESQSRLAGLRQTQQETSQQLEQVRQEFSAERARHASIEQILRERAYTADAVQKLFNANGDAASRGFRALGLLADYAEVQEEYEAAIEQFLREELEYVVVESFDQARAGVALLREDVGGRATFFVDSARTLDVDKMENGASMPGNFIARLDRLVEFREPLGPATKYFLKKLRTAYIVESTAIAEQMAHDNPHSYFLTQDGTCYHGRTVSGGRKSDAGPLALKRELRQRESETARLEVLASEQQANLARLEEEICGRRNAACRAASSQQMEAEKSLVAATHQRDEARREFLRVDLQLDGEREEISRLRGEAEAARARAEKARLEHAEAVRIRAAAEAEAAEAAGKLADLRLDFQELQERVVARREELAAMSERLASAEGIEQTSLERNCASERTRGLASSAACHSSEREDRD